jgi:hypothetical protein
MLKALLKSSRELVSDPARWAQGTLARDAFGHNISPHDIDAVCYCGIGAIKLKSHQGEMLDVGLERRIALQDYAHDSLTHAARCISKNPGATFPGYQDSHTHAEMLAVFDLAIKMAVE